MMPQIIFDLLALLLPAGHLCSEPDIVFALVHIIASAELSTLYDDILVAAALMNLCTRQESGCETAVHVMKKLFSSPELEAVIFVDCTDTYNSLNHTLQHTKKYPSF